MVVPGVVAPTVSSLSFSSVMLLIGTVCQI